jgi:hypothetical protein
MGNQKGGQANASGMFQALASAQAADQAYQLGTQQLQWAKDQWNAEQPMVQQVVSTDVASQQQQMQEAAQLQPLTVQAAQQDIATQQQQQAFSAEQQQLYEQTYQPLEQQYAAQAQQWASPAQQAINAGAAQTNVAEASESQRSAAQEQLEGFGINPGSTRFAGLDIGSRTMQAAAEAGAGTSAVQQTKLQGLGLEAGVVNTGRGLPNTVAGLASTGTGAGSAGGGYTAGAYGGAGVAGSGATGALSSNLAGGSAAMTAPTSWFNTGASNMNTYTNAVNGYNQSQLGYAQVGAAQSMGFGSLAGGIMGSFLQAGGPAIPPPRNSGNVTATPGVTAQSPSAIPPGGTPGGAIPMHASPSQGQQSDDVPSRLTVGEFVIPKDVVEWEGQKRFYGAIDKARQEREQAHSRQDVGGEHGIAPPQQPTFVSRPSPAASVQQSQYGGPALPSPANSNWQGAGPSTTYGQQGAIPTQRLLQRRAVG